MLSSGYVEVGGGGVCMCPRCCGNRGDDDDSYDAENPGLDPVDLPMQPGHTFNKQPEETGQMPVNTDFAHPLVL